MYVVQTRKKIGVSIMVFKLWCFNNSPIHPPPPLTDALDISIYLHVHNIIPIKSSIVSPLSKFANLGLQFF